MPNLPIDNMLFRENYEKSITTLQEFMDARFEYQMNMCEVLQNARQARFNRNKKNDGLHKGIPKYDVGDRVYVSFPKGRFRPLGKSTKLSPLNDGPYTILEKLRDGLVYSLKHERSGYIHKASVQNMIRVTENVIPDKAINLPGQGNQPVTTNKDRINDLSQRDHLKKIKVTANDEANGRRTRTVTYDEEVVDEDNDVVVMSKEQLEQEKKVEKHVEKKNIESKDEFEGIVAMDAKGKLKKAASNRLDTQIVVGMEKPRVTNTGDRGERARLRELAKAKATSVGQVDANPQHTTAWLKCTALLRKEHSQVTPVSGRDRRVRLGVLPPVGRNGVVSSRRVRQLRPRRGERPKLTASVARSKEDTGRVQTPRTTYSLQSIHRN
jgi:hypothetical protein